MTARPLLVFIRVRKPWTFERRRRFGWNVRLGMKNPALLSSTTANEWRKSINDSGVTVNLGTYCGAEPLSPEPTIGADAGLRFTLESDERLLRRDSMEGTSAPQDGAAARPRLCRRHLCFHRRASRWHGSAKLFGVHEATVRAKILGRTQRQVNDASQANNRAARDKSW